MSIDSRIAALEARLRDVKGPPALLPREVAELRRLEAESAAERDALHCMTEAELDAVLDGHANGTRGRRLNALRHKARSPAERLALAERIAAIAAMPMDQLDAALEAMRVRINAARGATDEPAD